MRTSRFACTVGRSSLFSHPQRVRAMGQDKEPVHDPSEAARLTDLPGVHTPINNEVEAQQVKCTPLDSDVDTEPDYVTRRGWGARHSLVTLACLMTVLMCTMRFNTSIAIVSMVRRPAHTTATSNTTTDVCPRPHNITSEQPEGEEGEFDWDEATQGLVLGAFFYGNVMTNVLGGRTAERIGAKPVVLWGMVSSCVLTLLSPAAARLSTSLFIAIRLAIGLAQGVLMPALNRCMLSWVPPSKRGKYNTIIYTGSDMGTVIALSLGGWLCDQTFLGGWPAAFYVFGGAGLLWCLAWAFLVTERPEDHKRISEEEKKYLLANCTLKRGKSPPIPWRRIVTSLPVWAIIAMHFGFNWGYYTFVVQLPLYLSNIQHFSVKSNGVLSALPYLCKITTAFIFSIIVDRATAAGRLSTLGVRRLSMIIASYIPVVGLVVLCLVECNPVAAVVVICLAVGVTGTACCGMFSSHQDISPNFSGTLYGVSNTIANTTGFIAPAVTGIITLNNQTLRAWNTVFLLSAAIYGATCTFYVFFISDQIQPFNNPEEQKKGKKNPC